MKKVFLVDDEIVIRENIRNCINWEREGLVFCGDAPDGEMALPLIEANQPDILITDIKMPFMDGLELSNIVRKRLPETRIILLSGHDEFEYARQALKLGVEEYCLKPIGSADLTQLLHRVCHKIDEDWNNKKEIEELKKNLHLKQERLAEKLIGDICNGLISSAEAIEQANSFGINLMARYYSVVLTDIRLMASQETAGSDLVYQIETAIRCKWMGTLKLLTYRRSRCELAWILMDDSEEDLTRSVRQFEIQGKDMIEAQMRCILYMGIGSIQARMQGIYNSFLAAEEDKHWRKLSSQNLKAWHDAAGQTYDDFIYLDRHAFIEFLKLGTRQQAESFLASYTSKWVSNGWKPGLFTQYVLYDLTLEVFRSGKALYRIIEDEDDRLQELKKKIPGIQSLDDFQTYLMMLCEHFWSWRLRSASKYGELIKQVKSFVNANYHKNTLSLQDAADHVNVSASHLSKLFSQETGQTFIEFLMLTRIGKALELLQSSNAKSYEIAYQVGYSDPNYFSHLFKRVTGKTIREFRKTLLPDG
ncbi:response regulator transcription factor [Gorillibacterium sp. sgz500922]|uniref:response regulator transcription factor n=1 Tax=Gorillibacterium sp. sgz500922 TaxID=3446694 RepID=UPI003F6799B5